MSLNVSGIIKTVRPAQPMIYAYTTPEIARHKGWSKIGYTEQDVQTRIQQQTHTADVRVVIEWRGNATWEDGSGTFHDTDFHAYLRKLNVENEPGTEWFHIDGPRSKARFYEFRENKGVIDAHATTAYTLRKEQETCVRQTLAYARAHDGGEFLWNAKPRFGKTLTTYDFLKGLGARKILIVTNRPAIANSWYDDYATFMGTDAGWRFVSSTESLANRPGVMTREQYLQWARGQRGSDTGFVEFVSLQDLKGSISFGGTYDKLREVKDLDWDVLVIDEAHEGVDTYKTDLAFDNIRRHFTLHLSGTPFKAIANEKFPEDAIYNWTYADEQQAKRDWPEDSELPNPYANLPRLNMLTYQMSDIALDKARRGVDINGEQTEFAFDLNEFFSTDQNGRFVHDAEVDQFLNALTTQTKFPFSTPELRDELRHTFWLLNRVDSARALAKKLRAHAVFGSYEIVLAADDGRVDDEAVTGRALDRVRTAIRDHERTITLSVGQLTTGVTVPEWTAVLMLCNLKSPSLYMQAAFRAQNPHLFVRNGQYLRKENAYVFDFDPARTLSVYEKFANDLYADTASGGGDSDARKRHIRRLLNFFPVYGEGDDGEMIQLDAERVLSIPRRIRSQEVVRRGFMCDFLFQNISNVFRAPTEVLEVIQRFTPYEEGRPTRGGEDLGITDRTADELDLDENGDVDVPEEKVIGTAQDVFGGKVYEDVSEDLDDVISRISSSSTPTDEDREIERLSKAFSSSMTAPLVNAARQHYGDEMSPARRRRVERKIAAEVDSAVKLQAGNYEIQLNIITRDRAEALSRAATPEDEARVNREHDKRLTEARHEFVQGLRDTRDGLLRTAGETVVREVETARREARRDDIQNGVKEHLRGFTRTIPSFLMAYGDDSDESMTTLRNFDTTVPADVFHEVTSITVDEFRFLRDGGDFIDRETGETRHFDGNLFDETVFDDSVREFLRLRDKLANYFDETQDEDIFDYVPPQQTNQIFTPKRVVRDMVDMLETETPGCFDDPTHTFADLYMKSGLYIAEIVRRLYNSAAMRAAIPDDGERLRHILERQVFGAAPSQIIYQIATHYILGAHDEIGRGCDHNFRCADTAQLAKEGALADWVEREFGDKL